MDSFLNNNANKRSRSDEVSSLPPVSKKPRPSAMQGNVTAAVRVAEFGKKILEFSLPMVGSCFVVSATWL